MDPKEGSQVESHQNSDKHCSSKSTGRSTLPDIEVSQENREQEETLTEQTDSELTEEGRRSRCPSKDLPWQL